MVARHDLTTDPAVKDGLLTVRRGTAFFSRKVNELSDADFDAPTLLPGWTRRHLVAHVGYNARALTRLVQWANTGTETPMYESSEARDAEIDFGSTLPVRALRHLHDHAAISLDVEWRDSSDEAWSSLVRTAQGREVPMSETLWMRTREVWLHAIDLDNGGRLADIPRDVAVRLLADILGHWKKKGEAEQVSISVTDAPEVSSGPWRADVPEVRGDLASVLGWASGRSPSGLDVGADVLAPRWL
ncbi:maleylpyruvate isomerase family mycothiol-dependent enzyme [Brevibacterium atlanticum]|uniref:maleylpyruvate isomerase family mycothiol-dependent enzyme n=1 Tax=Brevibacterium atlanticum TaxID=2697563 RepID=UPI0014205276|nr:maleylpyruvate isomerase family mycothiol-dependent enzyme [Brevibacterium atlanticum]